MDNKIKAISYMLFSCLCFAIMGALVKLSGDLPTMEKVFFRNIVSCFISLSILLYNKKRIFGKKENRKYLLARSILGTLGVICFFYSIDNMMLSDATMLNKLSPFFVSLLSVWFLKEKATPVQIPALILAFAGAFLVINPSFNMSLLPALSGFISAFFAGSAYTLVRFLGKREDFYTIVFYFSFVSSVVALPFLIIDFHPLSLVQAIMLLAAGITAAIAQFALTIAYKYAPAGEISIFNYTTVLFSGIIALIIWNEYPSSLSMIGYVLIIGAGLLVYMYNKKRG